MLFYDMENKWLTFLRRNKEESNMLNWLIAVFLILDFIFKF